MEIGVIFPQTEIEPDVVAIRDFAQAAQDMGYSYLFIADHVLGADASQYDHPLFGMYNHESVVHESLTTMGYLAAVVPGMGLMTGILILPQRQTALVAKQAAEIDVLCGGKLRLGIGVGWNFVEFEALGMGFNDRGARSAEQVEVMRELWTKESVDFHGKWHDITHAGINPLPVQRPIPVWLGVGSPRRSSPARRGSASRRPHRRRLVSQLRPRRSGLRPARESPRLHGRIRTRPLGAGPRRPPQDRQRLPRGLGGRGSRLAENGARLTCPLKTAAPVSRPPTITSR